MAEGDRIWMQSLRGLPVALWAGAGLSEPRCLVPLEGPAVNTHSDVTFPLFLRHYTVNFLHLSLVKEPEPNKTFLCPQSNHPSPLWCQLKSTHYLLIRSLCLRAHTTAVTPALPPVCQQPLCSFVFAARTVLVTLGNLQSDIKGPSIPLTLPNKHPPSLPSAHATTRMLQTSHQVLHLCCP